MRVLVPFDSSEMSTRALETACEEHPDAEIHVLHAIDLGGAGYGTQPEGGWAGHVESWYETAREEADGLLDGARETAAEYDVEIETHAAVGPPARTIVEFVEDEGVGRVVVGSHGRSGVSRILLGSVAETVVRRSPVPVLVVR